MLFRSNGRPAGEAGTVPGQAGAPGAPGAGAATATPVREEDVLGALARIQDPDLRRDIVSLGFVKDLTIEWHSREILYTMGFLATLVVLVFSFALVAGEDARVGPGIIASPGRFPAPRRRTE